MVNASCQLKHLRILLCFCKRQNSPKRPISTKLLFGERYFLQCFITLLVSPWANDSWLLKLFWSSEQTQAITGLQMSASHSYSIAQTDLGRRALNDVNCFLTFYSREIKLSTCRQTLGRSLGDRNLRGSAGWHHLTVQPWMASYVQHSFLHVGRSRSLVLNWSQEVSLQDPAGIPGQQIVPPLCSRTEHNSNICSFVLW